MKKFSIILVITALCCSAVMFGGCEQKKPTDNNSVIPNGYDLSNVAVGTKLPTLHPANFSYQYQKDDKTYMFHIDDFSVELYEKRTINEGDVITDTPFYPYTLKTSVKGTTDVSLSGKVCYVAFKCGFYTYSVECQIQKDGSFFGEMYVTAESFSPLFFNYFTFS